MATHDLVGRDIGNYHVVRPIGEGGMGAVFEARHRFLGDRVALKVLHGNYAHNAQIAQRFFQEAKSAREIGHPAIIKVLDFGQSDDGSLYLVMELLDGHSLTSLLARGALPEETAARIAAELAEGLGAAHARGVVHRDLKPDNIFIVGEGVRILDFGIAKVVNAGGHTGTNALLGTPKYMAPEQARGAKFVGPHSDIWSVGVILYEMLTAHLPFEGTDVIEIIYKISTEAPVRPGELAHVSPELETIVLRCLEKDPAARPANMGVLREMLVPWAGPPLKEQARVLNSAPTLALPPRPPTGPTTLGGSASESRSRPGTTSRARTIGLTAGAALLLLGGGIASVNLLGRPIPGEQPKPASAAPVTGSDPAPANKPPVPAAEVPAEPAEQSIFLITDPPNAEVYNGDQLIAITPQMVKTKIPVHLVFKRQGYKDGTLDVEAPGKQKTVLLQRKGRTGSGGTKAGEAPKNERPVGPGPGPDD